MIGTVSAAVIAAVIGVIGLRLKPAAAAEVATTVEATVGAMLYAEAAPAEEAVSALLDELHAAAAAADSDKYFALFDDDSVFMGTDPHERWRLPEFRAYAGARFAAGGGWEYTLAAAAGARRVTVVEGGSGGIVWFDEDLVNEKLGMCRGTGVARLVGGEDGGERWRIAHYSLTMAIPNEVALEVAQLAKQAQA